MGKAARRHDERKRGKKPVPAHRMYVRCLICGKRLRTVNAFHLRTHETTVAEYKEDFGLTFVACDETRYRISTSNRTRGAAAPFKPRSKEQILSDIRRYHSTWTRAGSKEDIPGLDILMNQAVYVFGTWSEAIRAAGLEPAPPHKNRSDGSLAQALTEWCRKHGPLNAGTLKKSDKALLSAVHLRYGNVQKAAETLGLRYRGPCMLWSKRRVLEAVKERIAKGLSLQHRVVIRENAGLYSAARKHFGSWGGAVEASGVDYKEVSLLKDRSPKAVATDLRKWCRRHGALNYSALKSTDPNLLLAAKRRFGEIRAAAEALSLPYRYRYEKWSTKRVVQEIHRRAGRSLSLRSAHVRRQNRKLYDAGRTHFGSWGKAIEESGFDYDKIKRKE
jgi:hypothetical protein